MAKSNLMDRVAYDLAKGHTHPAKQRLHSLIAAHPNDLDLRRQLAEIYRQTGDLVEAGRWSYLDESADEAELAAFERAFPLASRRAALRWPDDALAPTDWVRDRLAALPLTEPKSAATVRPRISIRLSWGRLAVAAVVCGLSLLGVYTIVDGFLR